MHTSLAVKRRVTDVPKEEDAMKGLSTNQDLSTVNKKQPIKADKKYENVKPNAPSPCGSGLKFKFCHGARK